MAQGFLVRVRHPVSGTEREADYIAAAASDREARIAVAGHAAVPVDETEIVRPLSDAEVDVFSLRDVNPGHVRRWSPDDGQSG